ncbi:GNAT family N-acetyltransferase [Micromonospora sp. URMC 103]|uniref:GNAT family N-acetyltransferase n=1 Tax=Micromonospora sp. URMC 103 TaxID=3423406 RepID=UPI003F1E2446
MITTIRDRQPTDVPACVDVLAEVHRLDGYPLNWPADPKGWLRPAELLRAWVAEDEEGTVVGHVALHRTDGPPTERTDGPPLENAGEPPTFRPALEHESAAEVARLFVAPRARGHHVARRLLERVRQWAAGRGLALTLEVVDGPGSAAVALYERSGWRHTGTTTADWTDPAGSPVTMRHYSLPRDARPH